MDIKNISDPQILELLKPNQIGALVATLLEMRSMQADFSNIMSHDAAKLVGIHKKIATMIKQLDKAMKIKGAK